MDSGCGFEVIHISFIALLTDRFKRYSDSSLAVTNSGYFDTCWKYSRDRFLYPQRLARNIDHNRSRIGLVIRLLFFLRLFKVQIFKYICKFSLLYL